MFAKFQIPYSKFLIILLISGFIFFAGLSYFFITNFWIIVEAIVSNAGVMDYGRVANTGMNYARTFSPPSTVNAEYVDGDTSPSAILYIKSVAASTREEKFLAHQKIDDQLDVWTCTTACDSILDWSIRGTLAGMSGSDQAIGFDIAYEQLSGRAMIVFADNPTTGKAYYCLWDNGSWSPAATCGATFTPGVGNEISLGAIGVPLWVRLVAQGDRLQEKRTNEMLLAVSGTTGFAVARWTGSAWTDIVTISTSALAVTAQPAMNIAWESVTGNGLVVFDATAVDGTSYYRKYVAGTGWDGSNTAGPNTGAGNNLWMELASDPMSNRISMIIGDSEADAQGYIWKSDNSTAGFTAAGFADATAEAMTGKAVATVWSRFNTRALFSFTDAGALTQDVYCWTTAGWTALTADVGGSGTDDVDGVIYIGSPNNANGFYMKGDILDDLTGGSWDGAGCASGNFTDMTVSTVWANDLLVGVNTAPIPFWFAYNPYSPWSRNWRWTSDTTNAIPGTWLAAENTAPTGIAVSNATIRLRLNFAELGGQAQTDARKKIQYSTDQSTWTDVGAQGGGVIWRYADCGAYADDGLINASTQLAGTTQAGPAWENGTGVSANGDHNSLGIMEVEYCLQSNAATAATTYYFRAYDNDQQTSVFRQQTSNPATPCAGASACAYPSLTTAAAGAVSLTFTVTTDNFGNVEPSVAKFATSTLAVATDNSSGWNVILYGTDQSPTDTVCEVDGVGTTGITDDTEWIPGSATTTAGNASRFGAEEDLAFRVMTASGTQSFISTTWWGTTDSYVDIATTLWAGIASSTVYRQIGNSSVSSGGVNSTSTNTALYYVRVPTTQETGAYSCPLVYGATVNP